MHYFYKEMDFFAGMILSILIMSYTVRNEGVLQQGAG